MSIHSIVPLIAAITYILLFFVIVFNRAWERQHKLMACYLIAASTWTFSAFLLRSDFFLDYKLVLFKIVTCASMWWAIQMYYFAREFMNLPGGWGIRLGYTSLGLFIIFAIFGLAPSGITFNDGQVIPIYGWWMIQYASTFVILSALIIYSLVKNFINVTEPKEHNKSMYLILAIIVLTVFGFAGMTPLANEFPVSIFGGLLSACVLTYAILKHDLVSVNLFVRRSLSWAAVISVGVVAYLALFFLIYLLTDFEVRVSVVVITTLAAIAMAVIVYSLRNFFVRRVDKFFFNKSYDYRQELTDFIRHKISGVFSLQELVEGLLPPLVRVVNCNRAYMLLPETVSGHFNVKFSEPAQSDDSPLVIKQNSPVAKWLFRENRYLILEKIDIQPEFLGISTKEKEMLKSHNIELLFPLVSRSNLIGILALSKKQSGKYSLEDAHLTESIVSQVAISMEKEYLQEELRKREQELSLINRLAGVITSSLNIRDVYDAFVADLREFIDIDFTMVALIDEDELVFSAISSEVGSAWKTGGRTRLSDSPTEWVATHKKSLLESDLVQDSIFSSGSEFIKRGIRSILYLPLITKGEVIGSLTVACCRPDVYTQTQINLLERLASQISTSVANSQLYAKAEQRARVDELTGLFNRRHFDEVLSREINRHSRYGSILSLVFIDLDNFKSYNDTMGHLNGDKILAQIGHLIKGALRNIDLSFRYGGDEFAIILPHSSTDDAYAVTERVRTRLTSEIKNNQSEISASLGLASWPSDGLTPDDLIEAADRALYHAKRTGGNRTCVVSQMLPPLNDSIESSSSAEKETLNTIYALAATIEARDPYTYGHSRKVRGYAVALAEALNLPSDKVAIISHAALLHDIGKIGILDEVLNKPGKLDVNERELIKTHPQLSRTIVGHVPSLTPCIPAILHHHERWDGNGYPSGLKDTAIPLEARILSIADSFDAMTSLRPYRAPLSMKEALEEIKLNAGTQFDPTLVVQFLLIAPSIMSDEPVVVSGTPALESD
jgi:diguanylate cyclase (GGDEF)-like protein